MEKLQIEDKIYEIRGQRVMLDRDLAVLYGVETKALNKAVKRNIERFPDKFMFQLSREESLRFQIGTSNQRGGIRYFPYAFSEQGVSMLSAVLRSPKAVKISIMIMDAFVHMRTHLASKGDPTARLEALDQRVLQLEYLLTNGSLGPIIDPPLPKLLSEEVKVGNYSERALVVFTEDKGDRELLKSIGARFNPWLTWHGAHVVGWIYPKSRMGTLYKLLPKKKKIEL